MTISRHWLLRWDTSENRGPEFLDADGKKEFLSQPASQSGSFAIFDGYLFDRQELCSELGIEVETSEPKIALGAYEKWSHDFFDKLRGGFVAGIWDEAEHRLTIGRDALGLYSCFYWWNGHLLLLSPSFESILRQPEVPRKINREAVAEFLIFSFTSYQDHETLYADVQRLLPAHTLSVTRRGLALSRYWEPLPPAFTWADQEELEGFEMQLERAVARCLSVGADSIALSGGFDSVSLAVVASGQLEGMAPLQAFSLRFTNELCDESPVQTEVARTLALPQLIRTPEQSLDGTNAVTAALNFSKYLPSPVLGIWQGIYTSLFRSAHGTQCRRMLLGTGGDEMMDVGRGYGADCLQSFRMLALWRFFRSCQRTSPFGTALVAREVLWQGALRPVARRTLSRALARVAPGWRDRLRARSAERRALPAWLCHSDKELVSRLLERRLSSPAPSSRSEGFYEPAMRRLINSPLSLLGRDAAYAWGSQLDMTFLYPFFDRDLVELSLRTHPEHLIAAGWSKTPLRRLLARRLPEVTMPAKKVDFTDMVHQVLRTEGREVWTKVAGSLRIGEEGLVEPNKLRPLLDAYFDGRNNDWVTTWQVLSTETWLRQQGLKGWK